MVAVTGGTAAGRVFRAPYTMAVTVAAVTVPRRWTAPSTTAVRGPAAWPPPRPRLWVCLWRRHLVIAPPRPSRLSRRLLLLPAREVAAWVVAVSGATTTVDVWWTLGVSAAPGSVPRGWSAPTTTAARGLVPWPPPWPSLWLSPLHPQRVLSPARGRGPKPRPPGCRGGRPPGRRRRAPPAPARAGRSVYVGRRPQRPPVPLLERPPGRLALPVHRVWGGLERAGACRHALAAAPRRRGAARRGGGDRGQIGRAHV